MYTPCNLNVAARNMVENIANQARSASGASVTPITIFAIGLGQHMKDWNLMSLAARATGQRTR